MSHAARSLFAHVPAARSGPTIETAAAPPPRAKGTAPTAVQASLRAELTGDAALIAILDEPLLEGETVYAGYWRKEQQLGSLFATLTVLESRVMHSRLSLANPGDALAQKFARLTVDRRVRLMTFLADARRREAMAKARK